jgi:putative tryptophan/tyrosine transport system substrate-binding protein
VNRRNFAASLAGAAITWPLGARAQRPANMPLVGYLSAAASSDSPDLLAAFHQGLNEAGYVEGRNVAIEYRWANDDYARLPDLAADLVSRRVAVIAATSTPVALAAKKATTTIPIAFTVGGDAIKAGLVTNFSRPDGNLTGVTRFNLELAPKRLELLHESVPAATVIVLLVNLSNPNAEPLLGDLQTAANRLGLRLEPQHAKTDGELDRAFAALPQLRTGALMVAPDPFFNARTAQLAALATRYAMPTIFQYRQFVVAGGLMSYGASNTDSHRQLGIYTGRLLGGAKPGDLPVQQSTKIELFVNLKTAKALGLTIPQSLLLRADEVIQ